MSGCRYTGSISLGCYNSEKHSDTIDILSIASFFNHVPKIKTLEESFLRNLGRPRREPKGHRRQGFPQKLFKARFLQNKIP